MDQRVEGGQNLKDLDARLQAREGFSTHMECHNLNFKHKKIFSIHMHIQGIAGWEGGYLAK